jgi:hypothetical protein
MEDGAAVAADGKEEERMTAGWVVAHFGLEDAAVLAVYLYGSRVYGTHGPASDWVLPRPRDPLSYIFNFINCFYLFKNCFAQDYVIVVESGGEGQGGEEERGGGEVEATIQGAASDADATVMSMTRFAQMLDQHSAPILECVFLPPHMKLRERGPAALAAAAFVVSPQRVREAASFRAGHSWSKARKKLEVAADRNVRVAKKSLFHSFRILNFALQVNT